MSSDSNETKYNNNWKFIDSHMFKLLITILTTVEQPVMNDRSLSSASTSSSLLNNYTRLRTTIVTSLMINSTENSSSNYTNDVDAAHQSVEIPIFIILAGTLLSIMTAGGNFLVIVSFKIDKQLQTISNYFLLSLAVADLTIGSISIPLMTYYTASNEWNLGYAACQFWLSVDYLMCNASVCNLLLISFDRYLSLTRPLTYRPRRTKKKAMIMIALTFVVSLLMWPPWIIAWPYIEGHFALLPNECVVQFLKTNPYVTIATAILAFYLPVTIMVFLYSRVYCVTRTRHKELEKLQAMHRRSSKSGHTSADTIIGSKMSATATTVETGNGINNYSSTNLCNISETSLPIVNDDFQRSTPPNRSKIERDCESTPYAYFDHHNHSYHYQADVEHHRHIGNNHPRTDADLDKNYQNSISTSPKLWSIRPILEYFARSSSVGSGVVGNNNKSCKYKKASLASSSATTGLDDVSSVSSCSQEGFTSVSVRKRPISSSNFITNFNPNVSLKKYRTDSSLSKKRASRKQSASTPKIIHQNSSTVVTTDDSSSPSVSNTPTTITPSPALRRHSTSTCQPPVDESVYTVMIQLPGSGLSSGGERRPTVTLFHDSSFRNCRRFSNHRTSTSRSKSCVSAGNSLKLKPVAKHSLPASITNSTALSNNHHNNSFNIAAQLQKNAQIRLSAKRKVRTEKRQERKAAKTLSAILLAFIVTWTPYNLIVCIETLLPHTVPPIWFTFSYYLCYINSTVNPICYALCNAVFRKNFFKIVTCDWAKSGRKSSPNEPKISGFLIR